MFERVIGRLFYSADIRSLIDGGLSLAGSCSDRADMEDMEDYGSKERQDATEARRRIAQLEGEIAAAKEATATFELTIAQLKVR